MYKIMLEIEIKKQEQQNLKCKYNYADNNNKMD